MPDEMISIATSGDTPDESPEAPDLEGAKIGADTDKSQNLHLLILLLLSLMFPSSPKAE